MHLIYIKMFIDNLFYHKNKTRANVFFYVIFGRIYVLYGRGNCGKIQKSYTDSEKIQNSFLNCSWAQIAPGFFECKKGENRNGNG